MKELILVVAAGGLAWWAGWYWKGQQVAPVRNPGKDLSAATAENISTEELGIPAPELSLEATVGVLKKSDPAAAFLLANSARELDSDERKYLLLKILMTWTYQGEAKDVWDFLHSQMDPPLPDEHFEYIRQRILWRYLETDLAGAVATIMSGDPMDLGEGRDSIVQRLAQEAPYRTADWVIESLERDTGEPGRDRVQLVYTMLEEIVKTDPGYVVRMVAEGIPGRERDYHRGISGIYQSWAREDITSATAWLLELLPAGKPRQDILGYQAMGFRNARDVEGFYQFLENPEFTPAETGHILKNATNLATSDLTRFLKSALTVPKSDSEPLLNELAEELFDHGFSDGGRSILDEMGKAGLLEDLDPKVVATWAQNDLGNAAAWVGQLPEGKVKTAGVMNIAAALARQSPVAAEDYVAQQPEGSREQEVATYAVAMETAAFMPEKALAWFDQIKDPKLRKEFLTERAAIVSRYAPERAAEYVNHPDKDIADVFLWEARMQAFLRGG